VKKIALTVTAAVLILTCAACGKTTVQVTTGSFLGMSPQQDARLATFFTELHALLATRPATRQEAVKKIARADALARQFRAWTASDPGASAVPKLLATTSAELADALAAYGKSPTAHTGAAYKVALTNANRAIDAMKATPPGFVNPQAPRAAGPPVADR
jgi:hypothetical protein